MRALDRERADVSTRPRKKRVCRQARHAKASGRWSEDGMRDDECRSRAFEGRGGTGWHGTETSWRGTKGLEGRPYADAFASFVIIDEEVVRVARYFHLRQWPIVERGEIEGSSE